MKLKKLILDLPIVVFKGNKEVEITGLSAHSNLIFPGNLFIAKKGATTDGVHYVHEAVASGASAILSDMGDPFLSGVTQLVTPDVNEVEAKIASRYYGDPSSKLFTVGVTGTNGKTTTTYLVKHLLDQSDIPTGLMGTIETWVGSHHYPAELTTPLVWQGHKFLKEMCAAGQKGAVMEASSIGLDQKRVAEIDFDCAIFTNFSPDHLDYHGDMHNYLEAKLLLFKSLSPDKTAVLPFGEPYTPKILEACQCETLTFGLEEGADLRASTPNLSIEGSRFKVTYRNQTLDFTLPFMGRHNVKNALAAIGAALVAGIDFEKLPPLLATAASISGRLEKVMPEKIRPHVFIDYAHTEDALKEVLSCLKTVAQGRVITVFGCGGDRDRDKRSTMGATACHLSDYSIVTSDNPRSEDPRAICQEIVKTMDPKKVKIVLDRAEAIRKAIGMARVEDVILIAGKGHESKQIFSSKTLSFDDHAVALEAMK